MESGPVFADSSGRRRLVMRYAGLGFAAVLAVCLGAIVVAMTGGPQAPFTHWAVQQPPRAAPIGHASDQAAGGPSAAGRSGNGQASSVAAPPGQGSSASGGSSPSAGASPSAGPSTSASPTAGPSATATASGSPVPTNKAGKTPPGRTKSPNPHKSTSVP